MIVKGEVERGKCLGHKLGFPTANLKIEQSVAIEDGVYHSRITIGGRGYKGVSNVGKNPTVNGDRRKLETHILDFDQDIYGQLIEVELLEKIRSEKRFGSVDELRQQIEKDIEQVKKL